MSSKLKLIQESKLFIGSPKVSYQLFLVYSSNYFDGFDFHYHFILDNQVSAKTDIHSNIFVYNWDSLLAMDYESPFLKLIGHNRFINRLKQTRTIRGVNLEGHVDDLCSKFILSHRRSIFTQSRKDAK